VKVVQVEWEQGFKRAVENYQHGYLQEAVIEFQSLIAETELAGSVFPELLEALALAYIAQGNYGEAEKLFDRIFALIDSTNGSCPVQFTISVLTSRARLYLCWGYYEKAVELYERALQLVRHLLDNLPGEAENWFQTEVYLKCNLGDVFRCQGRFPEAESLLRQARILCQRIGSKHALETVDHNLALLYLAMGQAARAEEILRSLVNNTDPSRRDLPLMRSNLGRANVRLGDYAAAEKILLQVVQKDLRMLDRGSEAAVFNLLADVYLQKRKYEQAEAMSKKSLAAINQTVGLNHRLAAPALLNLACARQAQGLLDGVESLERWALSNLKEPAGKGDPDLCRIIYQIASNHHSRGQYRESQRLYEEAIELHREVFGCDHPASIGIMARLALSYADHGKGLNAATVLEEAINLVEHVPDSVLEADAVDSLEILADLSCRLQQYGTARELYERAGRLITAASRQEEDCGIHSPDKRSIPAIPPEQSCIVPVTRPLSEGSTAGH
jgi:tetratricopeptide (TPR) repeat protein